MKSFKNGILAFLLLLSAASCEEVVEVDLEESEPRLVIEASLVWNEVDLQTPLYVKLSTTAPYFDEEIPPVENAVVSIHDGFGNKYFFSEIEPGLYRNDGFLPNTDATYELEVAYNEEVYFATASFITSPEIEEIEQDNNGGFTGDEIEIRAYFTDPVGKGDHYLFRFYNEDLSFQIYDDELIDGNRSFAFFSNEDLESGDEVILELQGISKQFYEYLFLLRSQAGTGGGPFQTQPTLVRGNIINLTNPDNFPFGFFRMSEKDVLNYQVQ
ncbi:DUF4249 domain-containing protein [Salinimicrobium sp. GXAS 041]|uniref:DUF4249 domain-containing protein n=1 Tax=Salinimicrobium sp. GXAS 041 TaxID=3400806 RepID=UPI003C71E476